MFMTDRVPASNVRRTGDGYLVADARVARVGIQDYLGSEVGRPDLATVRVYRPEPEVFNRDSLASYAHKPATNEHPAAQVTADTWKDEAIGQLGEDVVRDGDHVRVPLILMDGKAIKDYEAGKRELSMGYTAEIVFGDGVTPEGEPYDAVQKNIRINHIALVKNGRAGSTRIGDRRTPERKDRAVNPQRKSTMSDNTRTVMVDGLPVECTDAAAIAIAKLQKHITDADASHAAAIATKDADIAKRDAEIDSLKGKVLSDADIDARVTARADLITRAKLIADADYTGKSEGDIRKAAVVAKLGDAAIAGKADAYIEARFDIMADEAKADPVRGVLRDGAAIRANVTDNGYAASVAAFNPQKKES